MHCEASYQICVSMAQFCLIKKHWPIYTAQTLRITSAQYTMASTDEKWCKMLLSECIFLGAI